jgi:protein-S-isoprenylcysteine O-methyltransferase Ste14
MHCEVSTVETQKWKPRLMASDFEFRHRFWVIAAFFWVAFSLYAIDHKNSGHILAQSLAHLRGATSSALDHRLVFAAAALIAVLASTIRTWGTAYLRPEVMVSMRLQTSRLVADGPYRFVRNPLYLGNIMIAIAMGLMASRLGFLVLVIGNTVFVYRLILREEAGLEATRGDSYRAYCAAVPRLLPALSPRVSAAGGVPDFWAGLLGELFFWTFTASLLVFAVTLNQRLYYWVLGCAFLVYALSLFAIKRRGKRTGMAA